MISGPLSRLGMSDMVVGNVNLYSIVAGELQWYSSTLKSLMDSSRAGPGLENPSLISLHRVTRYT